MTLASAFALILLPMLGRCRFVLSSTHLFPSKCLAFFFSSPAIMILVFTFVLSPHLKIIPPAFSNDIHHKALSFFRFACFLDRIK